MKKKILTLALVIALLAIVVGGSLAYFTAEDEVTNTFTIGSVSIEVYENNLPTADDVNPIDEPLVPVVNMTAPSTDDGYIEKAVKVLNDGLNDAYVRTHIAIPQALVGYLSLDLNLSDEGWKLVNITENVTNPEDDIVYTVYTYDYQVAVKPNTYTPDVLKGVYLNAIVDIKDNPATDSADLEFCVPGENGSYNFSGFVAHNKVDGGYSTNIVNILVASQAIQAQGFTNGATNALNSGFGADTNPWA